MLTKLSRKKVLAGGIMTKALCLATILILPLAAKEPLAQRIVHTDPSTYRTSQVHEGAGNMNIGSLLETGSLETNLYFMHRGVIPPKSGIGHHFHNQCEEMFIIFDGEAQFTIDGRTSLIKGPAGAPCRMGHSHAVYNPTDKPVQWMNINVAAMKGSYDAFNLGDSRADVRLDPIPVFMTMRLDRTLLRPVNNMNGGTGTVQYRRALDTSVFVGPWAYVDHLVVPPGAATGAHLHREVAEVYYVMSGEGSITLSGQGGASETAPIRAGDAIPIQLGELHSFKNTGSAPLEFMITGVSRDNAKRTDVVNAADIPARGGR
jgi:mannose-6-phosphate isomerase-like protein (cupin superfamily)